LESKEKELHKYKALSEQLQSESYNKLDCDSLKKYRCLVLRPIQDEITNLQTKIDENKKKIEDLRNELKCYNVAIECLE
jgi:predicted RNase H-like nuclease (RuvC/YqgF family)